MRFLRPWPDLIPGVASFFFGRLRPLRTSWFVLGMRRAMLAPAHRRAPGSADDPEAGPDCVPDHASHARHRLEAVTPGPQAPAVKAAPEAEAVGARHVLVGEAADPHEASAALALLAVLLLRRLHTEVPLLHSALAPEDGEARDRRPGVAVADGRADSL